MTTPIFQVDAFTNRLFAGNPAAVCPLDSWLPDELMQQIAKENNLSETAFIVPKGEGFHIRWFTPLVEVKLCGHATLAASWVIFNRLNWTSNQVDLHSKSGLLSVAKKGDWFTLDFPADEPKAVDPPKELIDYMGKKPLEVWQGDTDYLLIYENEETVSNLTPDFQGLGQLPVRGIIASAKGNKVDVVSRFFAPAAGVNEDPVTGSAHTLLIPYWKKHSNKSDLLAHQISKRGGVLHCRQEADRVYLSGQGRLFLEGQIHLP